MSRRFGVDEPFRDVLAAIAVVAMSPDRLTAPRFPQWIPTRSRGRARSVGGRCHGGFEGAGKKPVPRIEGTNMTTQRKIEAAAALVAIVGVSIALRRVTITHGAALGLSPLVAVALVAGAAWAVPKLMETR
jgi:hypothetical protein